MSFKSICLTVDDKSAKEKNERRKSATLTVVRVFGINLTEVQIAFNETTPNEKKIMRIGSDNKLESLE